MYSFSVNHSALKRKNKNVFKVFGKRNQGLSIGKFREKSKNLRLKINERFQKAKITGKKKI
jgi:hypothetical protein